MGWAVEIAGLIFRPVLFYEFVRTVMITRCLHPRSLHRHLTTYLHGSDGTLYEDGDLDPPKRWPFPLPRQYAEVVRRVRLNEERWDRGEESTS